MIIFSWKMLLRCLLTRRNLFKRQVFGRIEEPHCVRCHGVLSETEEHGYYMDRFVSGAPWDVSPLLELLARCGQRGRSGKACC